MKVDGRVGVPKHTVLLICLGTLIISTKTRLYGVPAHQFVRSLARQNWYIAVVHYTQLVFYISQKRHEKWCWKAYNWNYGKKCLKISSNKHSNLLLKEKSINSILAGRRGGLHWVEPVLVLPTPMHFFIMCALIVIQYNKSFIARWYILQLRISAGALC